MKSIMRLLLLPLLAYGGLGNSMDDALNSQLLGTLVQQQSPVDSAATVAHTSPFGSVASMPPVIMDLGMPYGYDLSMPYAPPVMPYMGAGMPYIGAGAPYMSSYPYSGMGLPVLPPPVMAFPAYTAANPLTSSLAANQQAVPFASASMYRYY